MTLSELKPGEQAQIAGIAGENRLRRRLAEMGLVRGAAVTVERVAPLGDPRSYTVRGYQISLRNREARLIQVEPWAG